MSADLIADKLVYLTNVTTLSSPNTLPTLPTELVEEIAFIISASKDVYKAWKAFDAPEVVVDGLQLCSLRLTCRALYQKTQDTWLRQFRHLSIEPTLFGWSWLAEMSRIPIQAKQVVVLTLGQPAKVPFNYPVFSSRILSRVLDRLPGLKTLRQFFNNSCTKWGRERSPMRRENLERPEFYSSLLEGIHESRTQLRELQIGLEDWPLYCDDSFPSEMTFDGDSAPRFHLLKLEKLSLALEDGTSNGTEEPENQSQFLAYFLLHTPNLKELSLTLGHYLDDFSPLDPFFKLHFPALAILRINCTGQMTWFADINVMAWFVRQHIHSLREVLLRSVLAIGGSIDPLLNGLERCRDLQFLLLHHIMLSPTLHDLDDNMFGVVLFNLPERIYVFEKGLIPTPDVILGISPWGNGRSAPFLYGQKYRLDNEPWQHVYHWEDLVMLDNAVDDVPGMIRQLKESHTVEESLSPDLDPNSVLDVRFSRMRHWNRDHLVAGSRDVRELNS